MLAALKTWRKNHLTQSKMFHAVFSFYLHLDFN